MSPAYDVPAIRTDAIDRPRLLAALGRDHPHPALTIVHGHAGSGKSTLLAQWSKSLPLERENLVWIALHEDDAGILAFWKRIAEALAVAGLLNEGSGPDAAGGELSTTLHSTFGALRQPLILVLDDYHLVSNEKIDAQLRLLVEQIDGFRIVVGSRSTTGLHALDLAARVRTVIVQAEDLALTPVESRALVAAGGGDERLAEVIHGATGGWALASQALLIESQRDRASIDQLANISPGSPTFATDFARFTLESQGLEARDFLLRVSFADESTVEMSATLALVPEAEAKAFLDALERDGVGTWQTRSRTAWFRMHPLLREAFEAEARRRLDASTITRVLTTLSDHLLRERPLRALELAASVGDWNRVEQVVLLNWTTLSYYHRAAYDQVIYRVPAAAMKQHPTLMAAGLAEEYNVPGNDLDRMVRQITVLTAASRNTIARTGVVGAMNETMYAGVNRLFGDLPASLARLDRAHAILGHADADDLALNASAIPVLHAQTAIAHVFDRQYLRALDEVTAAKPITNAAGTPGERFQSLGLVAMIQAVRGDMLLAQDGLARCEEADPYDGWVGTYLQAGYHIAKSLVRLNQWDSAGTLDSLESLALSEPVIEYWPYLAVSRAWADALEFGPGEAYAGLASTLTRKRQRPPLVPALASLVAATAAQLLILDGQHVRAATAIRRANLAGQPEIELVRARLSSQQGDHASAIALADAVLWASDESPALRAEALLTLASCAFEAGQEERAGAAFADALVTLERRGLRLPLLTIGRERLSKLTDLAASQGRQIDSSIIHEMPALGQLPSRVQQLSPAERRVLRALRENSDVTRVADMLHLSVHTVRYHLKRGYRKLGVNARADAIAVAQELGMLDND